MRNCSPTGGCQQGERKLNYVENLFNQGSLQSVIHPPARSGLLVLPLEPVSLATPYTPHAR